MTNPNANPDPDPDPDPDPAPIDIARTHRREHLERLRQLTRELDRPLIGRLMQRAVRLRPRVARDGKGLTELEFVLGMLIELEAVDEELIVPFIKQFRTLDLSGDGRLGMEDLLQKESLSAEQVKDLVKEKTKQASKAGVALVSLGASSRRVVPEVAEAA